MNRLLSFILILVCVLCSRNNGFAQSMIFSGDSIVVPSCEKYSDALDTVHLYNNTDEELYVQWELTNYHFPHDGGYWMIFEPYHIPPWTGHGHSTLEPRDSIWIIFYMYHDTLLPGDSAMIQIKVYDPLDSVNTSQTLTAIQYCPLQTSSSEITAETQLHVFPNPVIDEVTIKIPEQIDATSLVLYSTTGEVIRQLPFTDHEITMPRDGLPGGMYFVGVESQGQVIGITKIILAE